MNNHDLIGDVYKSVINIVVNGIDEKYKDEVLKSYRDTLENRYANFKNSSVEYDRLLKAIVNTEKKEWESFSVPIKLRHLVKDGALEDIINISNTGMKYCREKQKDNKFITKEESDSQIEKMKQLLPKVLEHNEEEAKWYISEGTMDFLNASNQTESTSFRMAR